MKILLSIGLLSSLENLSIGGTSNYVKFSNGFGEVWTMLSYLSLYNCKRFGSLFNYRTFQNLMFLKISHCKTLIDILESIGFLKCLWNLKISLNRSLQNLPNSIGDVNMVQILNLWRCNSLKRLPKTLDKIKSLIELFIEECPIKKLSRAISQLTQLRRLKLKTCKNLQKLPTSIT